MNSKLKQGFTLIELLVVVAIIGILASIVLVSLNSARAKGRDASAKGSISSIRASAEIYYDTNNSTYTDMCAGGLGTNTPLSDDVDGLLKAAQKQTGQAPVCQSTQLSYVAGITLNNGHFFCVDSTGFAGDFDSANNLIVQTASTTAGFCTNS